MRSTLTLSIFRNKASQANSRTAFAFDIDGVLKLGQVVLPEATAALKLLEKYNHPFILVTNGGGVTEEERALKLSKEFKIQITPSMLVQSHTIFKSLLPLYQDKPILVIGGNDDKCRKVAENYGFKKVWTSNDILAWNPSIWPFKTLNERDLSFTRKADFSKIKFEAILGLADSHDWGRDSQIIIDLVRSNDGVLGTLAESSTTAAAAKTKIKSIPIHYSNPDLLWGNEFPVSRFGAGAFQIATAALYQKLTGLELEYTVGGKPNKPTYDYANSLLLSICAEKGLDLGKVYMVGDNPASDILGAQQFGWESILVKTGVFSGINCDPPASKVAENVYEGVVWALQQEKK